MPSPERIIEGVSQCALIIDLDIACCDFTCAHLAAILSLMPAVTKLSLLNLHQLESLEFLSSEPLRHTLTDFCLQGVRKPGLAAVELRHILDLRQLTDLFIEHSLAEKLDSFTKYALQVPSRFMPNLRESEIVEA